MKIDDVCHERKHTESYLTIFIPTCSNQHPKHSIVLHHLSSTTAKFRVPPSLPENQPYHQNQTFTAPQRNRATRLHNTPMILTITLLIYPKLVKLPTADSRSRSRSIKLTFPVPPSHGGLDYITLCRTPSYLRGEEAGSSSQTQSM